MPSRISTFLGTAEDLKCRNKYKVKCKDKIKDRRNAECLKIRTFDHQGHIPVLLRKNHRMIYSLQDQEKGLKKEGKEKRKGYEKIRKRRKISIKNIRVKVQKSKQKFS